MPKSANDNRPSGPLLQVVWVTKNGGRTRIYEITIATAFGSSPDKAG